MSCKYLHTPGKRCRKCGETMPLGNTIEPDGLNYFVVPVYGAAAIAGFQYRSAAEKWRHSHCRTGLILTMSTALDALTAAARAELEHMKGGE